MSREIKFRMWDGSQMQPLHLDDWTFCEGVLCHRNAPMHPVMQFTGLTDRDGNDIYEGDIVSVLGSKPFGRIKFFNSAWYYLSEFELYRVSNLRGVDYQVVGNIYKHHELLTPKTE